MEGHGVLRDKIDIKLFILFILRRLPGKCSGETLLELVLSDGVVEYFEYAECLAYLEETGSVEREGHNYGITEKGERICESVEDSLPYTLRSRLSRTLKPLAEEMQRRNLIRAAHETRPDGCRVSLSMDDGLGPVIEMRLLCGGEAQAEHIEENFREKAEEYYNRIMELLDE